LQSKDLATHDGDKDGDPSHKHPAGKCVKQYGGDTEQKRNGNDVKLTLSRYKGLPNQEQPEMHQQPNAREGAFVGL